MQAITIKLTHTQAQLVSAPVLTTGMVGLPVQLQWDDSWEQLHKTLVYRAGSVQRDQMGVAAEGTVPWEVLQTPGMTLRIGVYGTNADGTVVIPTVWVPVGQINEGAAPCADPGQPHTPALWQQMVDRILTLESSKPQLIWELKVPVLPPDFPYSFWQDEHAFRGFDGHDQPYPWNDGWWSDPTLPPNTTVLAVFGQLFDRLQTCSRMMIELELPGVLQYRGEAVYMHLSYEGQVIDKLTMYCGDPYTFDTKVENMAMVELSRGGFLSSHPVGSIASFTGMIIRVYAQEGWQ